MESSSQLMNAIQLFSQFNKEDWVLLEDQLSRLQSSVHSTDPEPRTIEPCTANHESVETKHLSSRPRPRSTDSSGSSRSPVVRETPALKKAKKSQSVTAPHQDSATTLKQTSTMGEVGALTEQGHTTKPKGQSVFDPKTEALSFFQEIKNKGISLQLRSSPSSEASDLGAFGAIGLSAAQAQVFIYFDDNLDASYPTGFTDGVVLALNAKKLNQFLSQEQESAQLGISLFKPFLLLALAARAKALGATPICALTKIASLYGMRSDLNAEDESLRLTVMSAKDLTKTLMSSTDPEAQQYAQSRAPEHDVPRSALLASELYSICVGKGKDPVLSWSGSKPANNPFDYKGLSEKAASQILLGSVDEYRNGQAQFNGDADCLSTYERSVARFLCHAFDQSVQPPCDKFESVFSNLSELSLIIIDNICLKFAAQPSLARMLYRPIRNQDRVSDTLKLKILEAVLDA